MDWFVGDDWRHNGAFFLAHAFFYMPLQGRARFEPFKKLAHPPFDFGTADSYDFYLRLGPLANADLRHFKGEIPYWNKLLEHNTYDDFWKARNLRPHLKNIKPAVLTVGGWFDAENLFGVLEAYRRFESGSPGATSTLVMGPWSHGGWNSGPGSSLGNVAFGAKTAEHYREKIELPFFEHHLKGKEMAPLAEALVFETGTNRWREYPSWPPKDTRPVTWHLHAGGKLAHEPPAGAAGEFDEYTSDPARPIPYTEKLGIRMIADYMTGDQRFAARRPDVLVYESGPLESDLTLVGPLVADLHVSTSGTDCDWIVKLIDVYPNDTPDPTPNPAEVRMGGYQQLVRGEVMRGRFRNSLEKPEPFVAGQTTPVKFTLPDVCHTFRAGHKVMVQVQSSWFPLIDRNPQTYVDPLKAKESDFQKATQRVYRSRETPSKVAGQALR
jgi:putative CocE/NonD family hydrolase